MNSKSKSKGKQQSQSTAKPSYNKSNNKNNSRPHKSFNTSKPKNFNRQPEMISPLEYFPRNDSFEYNAMNPIRKSDLKNSVANALGKKRARSSALPEINNKNHIKKGGEFDTQLVSKTKKQFLNNGDEDEQSTEAVNEFNKYDNLIKFDKDNDEKYDSKCIKPKFEIGDLILVCISEIRKDYMIANYTRNKKALIHREYSGFTKDAKFNFNDYFYVGQFVSAAVITPEYDRKINDKETKHFKIKCSIEPHIINSGLNLINLVEGMDIWGQFRISEGEYYPYFGFNKENEDDEEEEDYENDNNDLALNDDEEEEDNEVENDYGDSKKKTSEIKIVFDENTMSLIKGQKTPSHLKIKYFKPMTFHFFKITKLTIKEKKNNHRLISIEVSFAELISVFQTRTKKDLKKLEAKESKINEFNLSLSREPISFNDIKPGMIFSCVNTNKELTNGIEVQFGENFGTIFEDHLIDYNSQEQKVNLDKKSFKKVTARVIQVNSSKKEIALSCKENILKFYVKDADKKEQLINKVFKKEENTFSSVKKLYGDSYIIEIKNKKVNFSFNAFFHYSHININGINKYKAGLKELFEKKSKKNDSFATKEDLEHEEFDVNEALDNNLRIKEYNFFDNNPMLIVINDKDKETNQLRWEDIKIGQNFKGKILKIEKDHLLVQINDYIKGSLHKFHLADVPLNLKHINKFKINNVINVKVFECNPLTKKLTFTMKPALQEMKAPEDLEINQVLNFVYLEKDLFQHAGNIKGKLLNFKEVDKETNFKSGYVYALKICKIISSERLILSSKDEDISLMTKKKEKKSKSTSSKQVKSLLESNVLKVGSIVSGLINNIIGVYVYVYLGKMVVGKFHINNSPYELDSLKKEIAAHQNDSNQEHHKSSLLIRSKITKIVTLNKTMLCEMIPEDVVNYAISKQAIHTSSHNIKTDYEKFSKYSKSIFNIEENKVEKFEGIVSLVQENSAFPVKLNYGYNNHIENVNIPFYNIPLDLFIPGEAFTQESLELASKVNFYALKLGNGTNENGKRKKSNASNNKDTKIEYSLNKESLNNLIKNNATPSFEKGKVYPVRILKTISGKGLVLSLYFNPANPSENSVNAFCDLTEITDLCIANPLNHFDLGSVILARVLSFDSSLNKYIVSLRSTLVNQDTFNLLTSGNTSQLSGLFNKSPTDFRNKIYKYGVSNVIEQNMVSIGYVTSSTKNGVFIKLANNITVRAPLNELSDERVFEPFNLYSENQLVITRIISVTHNKNKKVESNEKAEPRYNASLRESVVNFNLTLKLKDLNKNNFYLCYVTGGKTKEGKQCVNVVGSTFNGELTQKTDYPLGEIVTLELTDLNKETFPPSKLMFSNANVNKGNFDQSLIINNLSGEELQQIQVFKQIWSEIKEINDEYKNREIKKELNEIDLTMNDMDLEKNLYDEVDIVEEVARNNEEEDDEEEDSNAMEVDDEIDEDIYDEDEDNNMVIFDHDKKVQLLGGKVIKKNKESNKMEIDDDLIIEEEDEDIDDEEDEAEGIHSDEFDDDEEEEDDEESNEEEVEETKSTPAKKAKSSEKRQKQSLKTEQDIRKKEKEIVAKEKRAEQGEETFESVEDFEKKILKNPSSSELWIMYAAFTLNKSNNYSLAKKVFERAIKTVDITQLKEKLNIWVAYLNFENMYGNITEFNRIVQDAIKVNDKKQIYKHLILIYKKTNNNKLIFEAYKLALKSFKNDIGLWKAFIDFLFSVKAKEEENSIDNYQTPKEALSQALQCLLISNKKIELLSHYAGTHYKYGLIEEGKTAFESLLKEHPKRNDIWLIYLDKETSFNSKNARSVFKKCLEKDHKIKALKQLVGKYLEFEKKNGSKEDLDKAAKYVQELMKNKMKKLDDEPEEDDDEEDM